jgi:hypothetical protein
MKHWWKFLGGSLLTLPLICYGIPHFLRPPQTNEQRSLFPGITYQRQVHSSPRPIVIHLVEVDLTVPGVRVMVSPGQPNLEDAETTAAKLSESVTQFDLQLAVNASFFYPFSEKTPWDFYPRSGDRVNVVGQAISNGQEYSASESGWAVLCFLDSNRVRILNHDRCPDDTLHAVAGNQVLINRGNTVPIDQDSSDQVRPYARVAVAIDQTGQKLWFIVVDGKQRFYSEGMTLPELTDFIMQLDADAAINLDGGGSTSLAIETASSPQILNAPIHTKIPMRERPIASFIGVYASNGKSK